MRLIPETFALPQTVRAKRSHFHHYITDTLSGPWLLGITDTLSGPWLLGITDTLSGSWLLGITDTLSGPWLLGN